MSSVEITRGSQMINARSATTTAKRWSATLACAAALLCGASASASQTQFAPRPSAVLAALPPSPSPAQYPLQLVLDDNTEEGAFGVTAGVSAQQFMWFNRFSVAGGYRLQQVWVLFPAGANITVGAPIQLAVYADNDGNPANGATLVTTFNTTVQAADDVHFSVYNLPQPVDIHNSADVLVGVVPRFVVSGTTPPTSPAAVDTTSSQGRSWVAVWSGDPPNPPTLPPDALIARLDDGLLPGGGNWMIRVFGTTLASQSDNVPTLTASGKILGALMLGLLGMWYASRRRARA
jgi:hypothetical protein